MYMYNRLHSSSFFLYIDKIIINTSDPPFWDLNNDKKCNIADINSVGSSWGEKGEPGWIPQDVNRDGKVNILDAVKVSLNWGKQY